uniref:Col_cuticle_N domain-containing protein n=1 Tax=Angiostrongylus cantonensis TaxID=6313 RepID=A0A0K0DBL2_ANGCA
MLSCFRFVLLSMSPVKPNVNQKPTSAVSDGKNAIEIKNYFSTLAPGPMSSSQRSTSTKEARPPPIEEALPFSCTPVYVMIMMAICFVLVIGAVTTVIDMKPEFLYGSKVNINESLFSNITVSFSALKSV